jgi:septum formation protein
VAAQFPGRFVLGADTIVVVEDQVLEKPRSATDAVRMLRLLSGRGHQVTTAVSLASPEGGAETCCATTEVFFRELQDEEIAGYVAGGEPMDKAGAYAIQGGAGPWVDRIEGEYSNVVGLPVSLVTEMLRSRGLVAQARD